MRGLSAVVAPRRIRVRRCAAATVQRPGPIAPGGTARFPKPTVPTAARPGTRNEDLTQPVGSGFSRMRILRARLWRFLACCSFPRSKTCASSKATARQQSFTRAAEELGGTPAAVSHRVRMLEKYLDVPLFDRQHRAVRLNRRGQAYLKEVQRILAEVHGVSERQRRWPRREDTLLEETLRAGDGAVVRGRAAFRLPVRLRLPARGDSAVQAVVRISVAQQAFAAPSGGCLYVQRYAGTQTLPVREPRPSAARCVDRHSARKLAGEGASRLPDPEALETVGTDYIRVLSAGRRGT